MRAVGAARPLIGADGGGQRVCGPCAGDTREWNCHRCGRFDALFADALCPRCFADDRLRDLLAGPEGISRPQLTPLLELLDAESNPYQILGWLHCSDWGSLLGRLAKEHEEITHALLDSFPYHVKPVHHLRQVLVTAGILPARDEYVDGVAPWLDTLLAAQPNGEAPPWTWPRGSPPDRPHWPTAHAPRRAQSRPAATAPDPWPSS
jgi:hypothetical protein